MKLIIDEKEVSTKDDIKKSHEDLEDIEISDEVLDTMINSKHKYIYKNSTILVRHIKLRAAAIKHFQNLNNGKAKYVENTEAPFSIESDLWQNFWGMKPDGTPSRKQELYLSEEGRKDLSKAIKELSNGTLKCDCGSLVIVSYLLALDEVYPDFLPKQPVQTPLVLVGQSLLSWSPAFSMKETLQFRKILFDNRNKDVLPGDWVAFANPKDYYELSNKKGYWSNENSMYLGKDKEGEKRYEGFGGKDVKNVTEKEMKTKLAKEYNKVAPKNKHITYDKVTMPVQATLPNGN